MNLKKGSSRLTKEKQRKRARSKTWLHGLAIILMITGISLILYTPIKTAYSGYVQKQLLQEIKGAISDSRQKEHLADEQEPEDADTASDQVSETEQFDDNTSSLIEESYTELTLMENETTVEESPEKTRERLKNQNVIGIIEIKKIDLIYAIVEGTSDENLGVAIGHMSDTAAIGQEGNCALAGHRGGTSGPYFKNVHKLVAGDIIMLTDIEGMEYEYEVTEIFVVEPTDVWVAQNDTTEKILTLITCTDNGSKRLIVRAKFTSD